MLLATGTEGTAGLYATAGFFTSLGTDSSLRFLLGYEQEPQAPVATSMGESCYEGLRLLAELCRRAGDTHVSSLCAVADQTGYDGPRGAVHLHDRHLCQPVYVARADGLEFEVLDQL